jgi:uncharacterized membrane protein YedE/YeeE
MHIDWTAFTPGPALFGGALLGIAAALYIHFHGRILGISGIVSGLLRLQQNDMFWRICFVLGLLTASFWAAFLFDFHPVQVIRAEWSALILAGLLVGFGAHYGSGLSRLSPRSLVATASFMGAGFLTVFIIRHVLS